MIPFNLIPSRRQAFLASAIVICLGIFSIIVFSDELNSNFPSLSPQNLRDSWTPQFLNNIPYNFTFQSGFYHRGSERHRYVSDDVWRQPDSYEGTYPPQSNRPILPPPSEFQSVGDYLKQPIIGDYARDSDKIFLMVKTGANVIWSRLPIHFLTTLTRVKNFAIYADTAGSVAGYEIIDVLSNLTHNYFKPTELESYKRMRELHDDHGIADASQTNLTGGWGLDRFKNIPMLHHAYTVSPTSDWFVFIDADTYIFMDNLVTYLSSLNPDEPLYLGNRVPAPPDFAHGGSGVVLSRAALEHSIGTHPEWLEEYEFKASKDCCGDAMVARMLGEKSSIYLSKGDNYPHVGQKFQSKTHYLVEISKQNWCQQILTFHKMTSRDIEIMWEYERLRGPKKTMIQYSDIYHDFVLPFIDTEVAEWDNVSRVRHYSPNSKPSDKGSPNLTDEKGRHPHDSKALCQKACEDWDECLMWRYIPNVKYCGLADHVSLGLPYRSWIKNQIDGEGGVDKTGITSGYNTARIKKLRHKMSCDPLYIKNSADVSDSGEDRSEGWALRERLREKKQKEQTEQKQKEQKEQEQKQKEQKQKEKEQKKKE